MLHYKDRAFCQIFKKCKHGKDCKLALTDKVITEAKIWWQGDNPPIAVIMGEPPCFEEK